MNIESFREYCLSLGEVEEKKLVANSFGIVRGKYGKKQK